MNLRAQNGGGQGMGAGSTAALKALLPVAAAPAMPVAASPPPPAPKVPNPLDSLFGSGVNGLIQSTKNQRDDLTHQGEQSTQDFNTMLARMADNRANDLLATNHAANAQGLFYSGQLGKRRDDVTKGYQQQQDDATTANTRGNTARQEALDRLGTLTADASSPLGYTGTGQAGISLADLAAQSAARQIAANAGGGADLAATLADAPASAAASAPQAAQPIPAATSSQSQGSPPAIKIAPSAEHGGAKWVYHRAANGTWMPVRPA
jgi:hypothetical protein